MASMSGNSGDFVNPGQKVGLEIWRIEKLHAVPVPANTYGQFYAGDCYIVLKTYEDKQRKLQMDLFFWLGKNSSQDERGGVAYKAVELDDQLGGKPVQHREVQGHESPEFLAVFPKGIQLLEGGVDSAFKHVDLDKFQPRLFQVKGKRTVRVQQVALASSAMNEGDVFILDLGKKIYQWNGAEANKYEKLKGLEITSKIKDDERGGKAELIVLDSGRSDDPAFWATVGPHSAVKKASEVSSDDEVKELVTQLIRVDGDSLTPVGSGPLDRSALDTSAIFIVDAGQVYVWVGKGASGDAKKSSMQVASKYLQSNNRPDWVSVVRVVEGSEAPAFTSLFKQWEPPRKINFRAGEKVEKKVAASDYSALYQQKVAAEEKLVDNGSGKVTIWRIENFNKVEVDPSLYGHFYGGDSYIVLYQYKTGTKDNAIIYFWQGRQSSSDEKGASALLTKQLFDDMGHNATQVRVVQNKEPNHFLSLFKGKMIVHAGGKASAFKNVHEAEQDQNGKVALFHIRGTNNINTHAVEVNAAASELNSGDCFVLSTPGAVYSWHGVGSNDDEKAVSQNVANILAAGRSVVPVEEGSESQEFWDALGGQAEYASGKELQSNEHPPRLFACTNSGAGFKISEVFNFAQDDLVQDDVMLLDAYGEVFVWVGKDSNQVERDESLNAALKYVQNAPDGRDPDTPVFVVNAGAEPINFTAHFLAWDSQKAQDFQDPYAKKLAATKTSAPGTGTPSAVSKPPASTPAPAQRVTEVSSQFLDPASHKFPLDQLKAGHAQGIDPKNKEAYLSDAEFQATFAMSRADFAGLVAWKKEQAKKKAGLF